MVNSTCYLLWLTVHGHTAGADSAAVEVHSSSMGSGEGGQGTRGACGSDVSSAGESAGSVQLPIHPTLQDRYINTHRIRALYPPLLVAHLVVNIRTCRCFNPHLRELIFGEKY